MLGAFVKSVIIICVYGYLNLSWAKSIRSLTDRNLEEFVYDYFWTMVMRRRAKVRAELSNVVSLKGIGQLWAVGVEHRVRTLIVSM